MRLLRIGGMLVALPICVWFGLGIRQADDTTKATAILSSTAPPSRAQIARAASLIRAAQPLNPDTEVDVLRAQLDRAQNELAAARQILERVVAEEPANAVAWLWLARSSRGAPGTFVTALERVRELAPPVPAPR